MPLQQLAKALFVYSYFILSVKFYFSVAAFNENAAT